MKNLRFFAYISSFLSLVISLAMIGLWISDVWELKVVNLNTFIGVTVSLLAIIVTLAIAWQIYNAVEMKNKVEELKQLEDRIKKQEKSFEKFSLETTSDMSSLAYGLMMERKDMPKAFYFMFSILEADLQLDDSNIDLCLDTMESMAEAMPIKVIKKIKEKDIKDIKELDNKIRSLSNYKFIRRRYEPLYDKIISTLEKKDE